MEQEVVAADEFRDGNVPAGCGNVRVLERALSQLPPGVERIYLRSAGRSSIRTMF